MNIFQINTVTAYNKLLGLETLHPLISVIDFSHINYADRISKQQASSYTKGQMNLYAIFLKNLKCGNIAYGLKSYDYEEGSLIFMAPGQVFSVEAKDMQGDKAGMAIVFHEDLLRNTTLGQHINEYGFFMYESREALHLSARERLIINTCFENLQYEISHAIDSHTKTLIISYLELFLNYCKRFYERQFNTRTHVNKDILTRFEALVKEYFSSDSPMEKGLPSVAYCAEQLFISPNYLSDLLRKETGKSAQEHIHLKMIELAKQKIFDTRKSISDIAYELGFKHPQHFTRMFKRSVGVSPGEYRLMG
ncbi:MAG TPA: helix-turn-helix transcriptional regulator [Chitinophagaceae bacterium]|nr:helix-turn-helix transcriptional regulator [Chitinophagaceae bacterium]